MVIIKIIILAVLTLLLAIMALILHRIGTIIRKWKIEDEKEARKQPEFWDDSYI